MQYFQVSENNNERRRVFFHLVDATDGITPEAGETGGVATISFNGRTPVDSVNSLVAVDASKGDYYLELAMTEISQPGLLLIHYKSANTAHFAQECQIMAFDPYTQFGTLGGGGADVDYKRIDKIITDAVSKIEIPESKEPEEFDYETLAKGFESIITRLEDINIPETDLHPVVSQLSALEAKIKAIKIPEIDLKPVMERIDTAISITEDLLEDTKEETNKTAETVKEYLTKDTEEIKKSIGEIMDKFDNTQAVILSEKPKAEKKSVLDEYLKL